MAREGRSGGPVVTRTVTGGDKAEAYLKALASRLERGKALRVGFLEDALYPDGTSVAMVAALQNFGTAKIPARPFFTNAVSNGAPGWGEAFTRALVAQDYDIKKALISLGMRIKGQIQMAIQELDEPALSAITLMLREMKHKDPSLVVTGKTVGEAARRVAAGDDYSGASTKPLIDTAVMLNRVDYEVDT